MDFPFNSEMSILEMCPEGTSPTIRKYICVWLFTENDLNVYTQEVGRINCDICKNENWAFGITRKERFLYVHSILIRDDEVIACKHIYIFKICKCS